MKKVSISDGIGNDSIERSCGNIEINRCDVDQI